MIVGLISLRIARTETRAKSWTEAYPEASFDLINSRNYFDYIR